MSRDRNSEPRWTYTRHPASLIAEIEQTIEVDGYNVRGRKWKDKTEWMDYHLAMMIYLMKNHPEKYAKYLEEYERLKET